VGVKGKSSLLVGDSGKVKMLATGGSHMIRTACVHCGRTYQIAEHLLGKRTRCRGCSQTFTLTEVSDTVQARPRPAEEDEAPWGM
jgi:hypothetical protein